MYNKPCTEHTYFWMRVTQRWSGNFTTNMKKSHMPWRTKRKLFLKLFVWIKRIFDHQPHVCWYIYIMTLNVPWLSCCGIKGIVSPGVISTQVLKCKSLILNTVCSLDIRNLYSLYCLCKLHGETNALLWIIVNKVKMHLFYGLLGLFYTVNTFVLIFIFVCNNWHFCFCHHNW